MKLKNISKKFTNKSSEKVVLNSVSLDLDNAGLIYIVGESGSGKTTLLNIISLNDSQYDGYITINKTEITFENDKNISSIKRANISYIKQEDNFIDTLTIYENFELSLSLQNKKINDIKLKEILNKVNIPYNFLEKYSDELSGGEKQKLSIVRAILLDHEIIVADEPTASLDQETKSEIMTIFKDLSKDKVIVIATHDLDIVDKYKGNVYEIKDGSLAKKVEMNKSKVIKFKDNAIENYEDKYLIKNFRKMFLSMPIRKILVILIASILVSIISHSLLLINVNSYKSITKLIENEEIEEFYISKENGKPINDYDFKKVSDSFKNNNFYMLYNESIWFEDHLYEFEYNEQYTYYKYSVFSNSTSFSEKLFDETNMKLLAGRYPEISNIEGLHEVLISEFHFEYFQKFGYVNNDIVEEIKSYEDLINKVIYVNYEKELIIKGVYSNKEKLARFEYLKNSNKEPDYFTKGFTNELSTSLIVHDSYYDGNEEPITIFTPVNRNSKTEIKDFLTQYFFKNENYKLTNREIMFYSFSGSRFIETIKFILLSVFLIVVSSMLLYSQYVLIFNINKLNIGNILSLGYKRRYIFKLFNIDSIFNTICIFLITSIATIFMLKYYNNDIIYHSSIDVSFYRYNVLTFILILLCSYLVSLISNIIIYNIQVKKDIVELLSKERL